METPIERVLRWTRERGWSQNDLAAAITDGKQPVTRQMLSNWKARGLPEIWYYAVGKALGRTADEVANGERDKLFLVASNQNHNVRPATRRRAVPMISFVQAGELAEINDFSEVESWVEPRFSNPGDRAFALLVQGDSMAAPDGSSPSFPPGTTLIVDPDRGPQPGDFVIAKDIATQRATFKRLTGDGVAWYLKPLNPSYPTYEIDDPSLRVIGVVTEYFVGAKL